MSDAPLRTAVVGYGYWGPNLTRNVAVGERTELAAVCDRDSEARRRAGRTHPQAAIVESWEEVLADGTIEAVVIALPVALHHRFALEALRAGKHVLVEKPLARTLTECDELVDEAERTRRVLMVGHTFEFNAAVRAVRRYLDEGELGEPYYIAMRRTNLGIVRSDVNAMWSLAAHDVSILCSWLDASALTVNATGAAWLQDGVADVVFVSIRFAGDVLGHIHCSWLDPNKVREATIVGSRKMAVYDDVSPDAKLRLYDKGINRPGEHHPSLGAYEDFARFQTLVRAGDVLIPKLELREPLGAQVEHFATCIREGRRPISDGASGRRVVAILEAAQRSLDNGGRSEEVPVRGRLAVAKAVP